MNITVFNREYWIRRFEAMQETRGYMYAPHKDFVASLHVHPGQDSVSAQPEGARKITRLEGHGNQALQTANQKTGVKGDLLYYQGDWYECVSCVMWDHTMLSHYNYQFSLVPSDASGNNDLDPPRYKIR